MDTQPLFYKKPVPLNKDQHGDLYLEPSGKFKFTKETNSVYIAAVEFIKAARDYAIVFGKSEDGSIFPSVLFGLQNNQNMYLGRKGEWLVDYIPAYVRRYPFILATSGGTSDTFAVCIDESYSGFNRKKKGQRLFEESGEESDILKRSIDFLKEFQNHIQLTNKFCSNLRESGLLDPMQAKITRDGTEQALGGFLCVNRERLKGLEPKKLAEFMISDHLELIFAHLYSLNNLNRLVK
jgi:hypothetical protein